MNYTLIAIVAIVLIVILVYISAYNKLKQRKNQIDNAFSVLDALFIKRNDLIPNLIATVRQYMDFERDTLDKITQLRTPSRNSEEYQRDGEIDKIMKQLMVQVENYPQLKASEQFTNLQYSFNECEEQIAAGRRFLSASITDYNNAVALFPSNIVAGMSGMKKHEWERATEAQRQNVNANELFK
ncbi:LemA protein [Dysgonomonas sp. PH5-45]|uniref:LemA family protein n=1 Tax=unclassified Dysgonomonas TaxID=2630389 RepID=UPI002476CFF6|nr:MULTISPECIES: LemA family protein [unclassified Dysgonomonas]MDH6354906.1 LemA protein [Dysgonomonas sp. PH5-45]MDH6387805.1 LemA protein [Dysgonomonas sp. PH5-37]